MSDEEQLGWHLESSGALLQRCIDRLDAEIDSLNEAIEHSHRRQSYRERYDALREALEVAEADRVALEAWRQDLLEGVKR